MFVEESQPKTSHFIFRFFFFYFFLMEEIYSVANETEEHGYEEEKQNFVSLFSKFGTMQQTTISLPSITQVSI